MRKRHWFGLTVTAVFLTSVTGCLLATPVPSAPATTPFTPPKLVFPTAPVALCRDATQLRLRPLVEGVWPEETSARWQLVTMEDGSTLAAGTWLPEERELFVSFPQGGALPPNEYDVVVTVNEMRVGHKSFTVQALEPQLTDLSLGLTPTGPAIEELAEPPHVVYITYSYQGSCPGATLWAVMTHQGETVCSQQETLEQSAGEGALACYRGEGAQFEPGAYEVTVTLSNAEVQRLTFRVKPEPVVVTPTLAPHDPVCEEPFAAMGLSPEGTSFRALDRFEWYTQAVYVGVRCRDLPPEIAWEARWYRNGQEIRVHEGQWEGGETGVIWDSLTGVEGNPFLIAGAYSATLTLTAEAPISATFRVVPYIPPE